MIKNIAYGFVLCLLAVPAVAEDFYGVWFDKPVSSLAKGRFAQRDRLWERYPLAIGNGYMGAMVFGETDIEELQFNEKSFWAGHPNTGVKNPEDKGETFKKVQSLYLQRNIKEAEKVGKYLSGDKSQYGRYLNMGSFKFDVGHELVKSAKYFRGTDLNTAINTTRYEYEDVQYSREYFASYPARAILSKWTSSKKGAQSFKIYPQIAHPSNITWEKDTLHISGKCLDNDLPFEVRLKIDAPGAKITTHFDYELRKASMSASNHKGAYAAEFAYDGSDDTYWLCDADKGNELAKAWLVKDYGEVIDIEGFTLDLMRTYEVKYIVETSDDGKKWRQIYESNPVKKSREVGDGIISAPAKTRYLRLRFMDWQKYWVYPIKVAEFAAIEKGASAERLSGPYLEISKATDIEFALTSATGYKNHFPDYRGESPRVVCDEIMKAFKTKNYEEHKRAHQEDYAEIYDRVTFTLPSSENESLPITTRKSQFRSNHKDQAFIKLYYDACRYLMIASSRKGSLPANLQGVWNGSNFPIWNADYHTNINVQMTYWAASVSGMDECLDPLFDYIEGLVAPGTKVAKEFYGARGWVVNTASNVWGYTSPDNFVYGWAPYGASWMMQRMWEHYAFTADKTFLRERCYPLLKDIAFFWEDYLVEDSDGTLVSAPSYSPEHGPKTVGCTFDQVMAWNHLTNCIDSSKILGVDSELRDTWSRMRDKLSPIKIGKWGQMQEWKEDIDDPKNRHRHINHLFAIFPGRQVSPVTTPELAAAATKSIAGRGDSGPGWSTAWKVGILARLFDAEGTYKKVHQLATDTYDNMFGAHRVGGPFQIDSNGGGSSAIPEMILQSHMGFLHLLPALPSKWPKGSFEGLRARGGYICDIFWKDAKLDYVRIRSRQGGSCRVRYGDSEKKIKVPAGGSVRLKASDF